MWEHACGPPKWFYETGTRPASEDAYLENMTRVIFQAGLNWKVIEKKWSIFQEAFKGFSIEKVSRFGVDAIEQLMANEGIVRNRRKILATIYNAGEFKTIKGEFGSFQAFIDTMDKSENYALVVEELSRRFKHLGSSSTRIFLFSVGEDVKHLPR